MSSLVRSHEDDIVVMLEPFTYLGRTVAAGTQNEQEFACAVIEDEDDIVHCTGCGAWAWSYRKDLEHIVRGDVCGSYQ